MMHLFNSRIHCVKCETSYYALAEKAGLDPFAQLTDYELFSVLIRVGSLQASVTCSLVCRRFRDVLSTVSSTMEPTSCKSMKINLGVPHWTMVR